MSRLFLLLILLTFLGLLTLVVILVLILWNDLKASRKQNQDLLNRLMSQDVQTFERLNRMTEVRNLPTSTTSNIVPMSDAAEYQRFANRHGLGEVITEDPSSVLELQEMFEDLNLGGPSD